MNTFDEMEPVEKIKAIVDEIDGGLFGLQLSLHADQNMFIEESPDKVTVVTPNEEREELIEAMYDSLNEIKKYVREIEDN